MYIWSAMRPKLGKDHPGSLRLKPLGPRRHTQESQTRGSGNSLSSREARPQTTDCLRRSTPKGLQRVRSRKGRPCRRRARAGLVKKKNELGLKGPLKGHHRVEVKKTMVAAINESIAQGLTQKEACRTIGLSPKRLSRWANPKPRKPRTAWNKLRDEERDAIEAAAWLPDLIGKPVSHVFVHGHDLR